MVGYTEALTDPSYNGQLLTLTYPLVGNYGVPDPSITDTDGISKFFESNKIQIRGLVIHELSLTASHWNLSMTLDEWMYNEKIPGISGIDTRALTMKLRNGGVMMAALVVSDSKIDVEEVKKQLASATHYDNEQFMDVVSTKHEKIYGDDEQSVVVIDTGAKKCNSKKY
jgi:carbamoyl-phosphate synthase small subunit